MATDLQDFSVGSPMYKLVRGYNERRGVLGLGYRAYSGESWVDVADLSSAVVAPGANIQKVAFWRELQDLPETAIITERGTEYEIDFGVLRDDRYDAINEGDFAGFRRSTDNVVYSTGTIQSGDILGQWLIHDLFGKYRLMSAPVFKCKDHDRWLRQKASSLSADVTEAFYRTGIPPWPAMPGYVGTYVTAYRKIGSPPSPLTELWTLTMGILPIPTFAISPQSAVIIYYQTNNPEAWADGLAARQVPITGSMAISSGDVDLRNYFSTTTPPLLEYWSQFGPLSGPVNEWSQALVWVCPLYQFQFSDML
jgi:hypothetical protein